MKILKIWEKTALFCLGGAGYVGLEYAWRGRSHISMFFAGGTAFLLLGNVGRTLALPLRAVNGAAMITAVELAAGLLVNREYRVWDYRQMPCNLKGQICLPFSLLWIPVSAAGIGLYDALKRSRAHQPKPVRP